ncbi:MAG TPA: hypothetical protein VG675_06220 [Bryobacteraceae bacterium]|nr:hypothetical protein [Bryobacteraceae bacterium]
MKNRFRFKLRTVLRGGGGALVVLLALFPLGCKRANSPVPVEQTQEEAPQLASTVHMSDPKMESQLLVGFYGIEQNSWRWTAKQFSVVLHPPFGSGQNGATLQLDLSVPDVVINKLHTVSLAASVSGNPLPPETYTRPGDYTYKRDVPANLLSGDTVRVDFQLDKAMPPAGQDMRELGIVVKSVGLEPK